MTTVAQSDEKIKEESHYVTGPEARKFLRLSLTAFYRLIYEGRIPFKKIKRMYLIPRKFLYEMTYEPHNKKAPKTSVC